MAAVRIELRLGGRYQQFSTDAMRILMGKGGTCNLRVPLSFLQDQHLEIDRRAGLLRVRTRSPGARAYLGPEALNGEWTLAGSDAFVEIPSGDGAKMTVAVILDGASDEVMPLMAEDESDPEVGTWAGPIVASPEGEAELSVAAPQVLEPLPAPREPSTRPHRLRNTLTALIVVACLAIGGAVGWNEYGRGRTANLLRQDMQSYLGLLEQARGQVAEGRYAPARTALNEAFGLALSHRWDDQIKEAKGLLERPEIQYGALGYLQIDGKWVEPSVASVWQEMKQKNNPRIERYIEQARASLRAGKLQDAGTACAEAMALMEQFPAQAKPHVELSTVQGLAKEVDNQLAAKEMLAKGMVLYNGKWMSPAEQFRAQQIQKGMVEYKGKWMTAAEAFTAGQIDKGLVLHEGKWMTPEDKLRAQGYIEVDGQWLSAEQQQQAVAQKDAKRVEAERLAEARRGSDDDVARLKREAYEQSQNFFRQWRLKRSKQTIMFPAYSDPLVKVDVMTGKDAGWLGVRASYEIVGAPKHVAMYYYVCQLRQKTDGTWECLQVGDPNTP